MPTYVCCLLASIQGRNASAFEHETALCDATDQAPLQSCARRLRIGLSAAHSTEDIDALTDAVKAAFSRRGIAVRTACPEQLQPSHTLRPVAAPLAKL